MRRIVRESKFRHIYGQPNPKDQQYDGVTATNSRLDGNICAVNRKYIAVVLTSTGSGFFTVLSRSKPGRVEKVFKCLANNCQEVVDLNWDRRNPNRIVSGCEDGGYYIWVIPEGGLTDDFDQYECLPKPSQRRVVQSEWHPSAEDILIGINIDSINIFNLQTFECIRTIETYSIGGMDGNALYSLSLNYNGSKAIASFKDKKARVFDLISGDMIQEFSTHEGSRAIRVAWLADKDSEPYVVTTGATKMSGRQLSVWKLADAKDPLSVAFGTKLSCNFMANEVIHAVRVVSKGLEEISFIVPRKSELFQDDLFPDTFSETASMSAQDFEDGKISDPALINLKTYIFPDGTTPSITRSSTLINRRETTTDRRTLQSSQSM
ncbi:hypothetical protein HZS_4341, partial [Henneguya salminicola]